MTLPRFKKISKDQFGDTIIEVILAIAALGSAIAVAYISTGHSLQVGIDAGNRSRVVGLAQKQIERLKANLEANNDDVSTYSGIGGPFCINSSGSPTTAPIRSSGPNQNYCEVCINPSGAAQAGLLEFADKTTGNCRNAADRPLYAMQVTYSNLIFTVNSRWVGPGDSQSQQTQYYKVPGINGVPLGNPGGPTGDGPTSCTLSANVQVDAVSKRYLSTVSTKPSCSDIIQRSTFPGYPIIWYTAYDCYSASGTYSAPNSPATSYNYDQVLYPGGVVNRYIFFVKNSGDQCTIEFTWKGWDVRWPNPRYIYVTCRVPAATCTSTGLF